VNQLVNLYNTFSKALDDKKDVHSIFCDITEAFDRVWHDGLLYKLKAAGICGNLHNWFNDYLYGRKQRVVLNGQSSSYHTIWLEYHRGQSLGHFCFSFILMIL
jgi:hypothetical protein